MNHALATLARTAYNASMPAEVRVYTTRICHYCVRAKALLNKRGIAFVEIDVSGSAEKRDWLVQVTGRRTVPQIFVGDEAIGGYDELVALDRTGALMPMVVG
jgi:glutaredoxin 3